MLFGAFQRTEANFPPKIRILDVRQLTVIRQVNKRQHQIKLKCNNFFHDCQFNQRAQRSLKPDQNKNHIVKTADFGPNSLANGKFQSDIKPQSLS